MHRVFWCVGTVAWADAMYRVPTIMLAFFYHYVGVFCHYVGVFAIMLVFFAIISVGGHITIVLGF